MTTSITITMNNEKYEIPDGYVVDDISGDVGGGEYIVRDIDASLKYSVHCGVSDTDEGPETWARLVWTSDGAPTESVWTGPNSIDEAVCAMLCRNE